MEIGHFSFKNPLILAPMAGITDAPFRRLCKTLGADYCVSEMVTSKVSLWSSEKTDSRLSHFDGEFPLIVQIVGGDAKLMSEAAKLATEKGANIIDINMGCPAKKVFKKDAGSALLANPKLVESIVSKVVKATTCPVTVKMRTGIDLEHQNALYIADIIASEGASAITIHGRSRACRYEVPASYAIIKEMKKNISIPIIANGDITDGEKAMKVSRFTGADGLMIGRAAQRNPWIFQQIKSYFNGQTWIEPSEEQRLNVLFQLVTSIHEHYGAQRGLRMARKHFSNFLKPLRFIEDKLIKELKILSDPDQQLKYICRLQAQIR